MADMPGGEDAPPQLAALIMHAALTLDDGALLMASDVWDPSSFGGVHGMHVNHTVSEVSEAERVFAALAEAGHVEMPLEATFWSPAFGHLVDRFGTPWMVDAEPADT